MAYLLDDISKTRGDSYSLKLKVEQRLGRKTGEAKEMDALPMLGLALNRVEPGVIQRKSFALWSLSQGTVKLQGRSEGYYIEQEVHKVKNGGEILVHFVLSSAKLSLTITNPREKSVTQEINILTDIPNGLVPYAGVMITEGPTKSVTFTILDVVSKDERDISQHVTFSTCYGTIEVSPNRLRVGRTSVQQGNGCAILPVKVYSGKHRWTFIIHSDFGASFCVGLARYPFKLLEEYIDDQLKHIYKHPGLAVYRSYRGLLYRDGREMNYSLDAMGWMQGHPIQLELVYDAFDGKLEILKNGKNLGVAFEGLSGAYQPILCFYAAYEKDVELKSYMTTEPLFDVLITMSPFSSLEADGGSATDQESIIHVEDFCFDESSLYGKLGLSEDKKAVFRTDSQSGNAYCFANIRCSQVGIYRFSFIVEVDQGASTCIGVTEATSKNQVKISGHLYNSKQLHLYRSFQGMIYIGGKEQPQKLEEFWMSGTLVEMEVNITGDESFVCFKINAADQGVGFPGLQPPLTPVVAFYAGMEKRVTFLHFEFQPITRIPSKLLSRGASSGLNNTATSLTHAPRPSLPPVVTLSDAVKHSIYCSKCDIEPKSIVDIIPLPCKHAFLCSKHLSIGLNAATRRCTHCDQKITQIWNVFRPPKP